MTLEQYKQCRNAINRKLKNKISHNVIRFGNISYNDLEDGVHLNHSTNMLYANLISNAVKRLL